jgi:hypothetical protein
MSQFIYSFTGKQRPAPIVWETVSFKLTGGTGKLFWTDRQDISIEATRNKPVQWMPLDGAAGIITGAKHIQVRLEEITDESVLPSATLEVHPAEGPENRVWGLLAQMRSNMHAVNNDLRVIAALI